MAATNGSLDRERVPGLRAGQATGILPATVASEWTKLRSVRSTYWTLAVLVLVSVGFGAVISAVEASYAGDPTALSLSSFVSDAPFILAVLGALTVTSEYSSGMIRTSLIAQPHRGTLLAGKALVFTGIALAASVVTSLASFLVGQSVQEGHAAGLSDPGVLRAVVGVALYATVIGLTGLAFGLLIRHTAAALSAVVGLLVVLPLIAAGMQAAGAGAVSKWLPTAAAGQLTAVVPRTADPGLFSAWPQFGVTIGWAAILLGAAAVLFDRRDA